MVEQLRRVIVRKSVHPVQRECAESSQQYGHFPILPATLEKNQRDECEEAGGDSPVHSILRVKKVDAAREAPLLDKGVESPRQLPPVFVAEIRHLLGWFGTIGKRVGQFYWVHEMHCVSENEIYTGEAQNWRVQRVTMKPAR